MATHVFLHTCLLEIVFGVLLVHNGNKFTTLRLSYVAVMIVNELRSESVHDEFMEAFGEHFSIRKVAHSHMHPVYQHPELHIFILKRKMLSPIKPDEKETSSAALQRVNTTLPESSAGREGEVMS